MSTQTLKTIKKLCTTKFGSICKFFASKPKSRTDTNSNFVLHPKQIRLKELQRAFQKDDGLPVHMKTPNDRMLVKATYVLAGIGMLGNLQCYYELAKLK